jgi:glycosylphosphatidylinositol transamidase (GPIT) subunit GPI8
MKISNKLLLTDNISAKNNYPISRKKAFSEENITRKRRIALVSDFFRNFALRKSKTVRQP